MAFVQPKKFVKSDLEQKPIMIITTDDNHIGDYLFVYPLLRKRGIPVTTYIIPSRILGVDPNGFPRDLWIQPPRLKFLMERGWDIQCHTFTHRNLNNITQQEIHEEMQNVNNFFAENGLPAPKHTAYPLGAGTSSHVLPIVKKYRLSTRSTGSTPTSTENPHPYTLNFYQMGSQAIDFRTYDQLDTAKSGIDQAISQNKIFMTNGHFVKFGGAEYNYEEKIEYLEEFLDYAIQRGIRIMTVDEAYNYVNSVR